MEGAVGYDEYGPAACGAAVEDLAGVGQELIDVVFVSLLLASG